MKLEAEDLVAQFQHDWPDQYQISTLRHLVDKLTAENEQLKAQVSSAGQVGAYPPPGPYVGTAHLDVPSEGGGRHGG